MTSESEQTFYPDITIRNDFQYGDLGKVLFLHGQVYSQEYGFNHEFESYVAEGLAEFAREYRKGRSSLWIAEKKETIVGSIAIFERSHKKSQLRWFLVHPAYQGLKLGKHLISKAISFCKEANYDTIFLWTLSHLSAARAIYLANGFHLTETKKNDLWGKELTEECYTLRLK